jgi:hypothetical protein
MNLSTMLDPNTLALLDQLGISAATVESALASLAIFTILTLVTAIPTVILAKQKGTLGGGLAAARPVASGLAAAAGLAAAEAAARTGGASRPTP